MDYTQETEPVSLRLPEIPDRESVARIVNALGEIPGVGAVSVAGMIVTVERVPEVVSEQMVQETLEALGVIGREQKKRGGFFARTLERMAESNRKQFGSQRLDCCDLPKE